MVVDALALLLILLVPFDWLVAGLLLYIARLHPSLLALRERAVASVVCAIAATIAGVLGWARLGVVTIPSGAGIYLITAVLILVSLPSLYWLFLLATGRWRLGGHE